MAIPSNAWGIHHCRGPLWAEQIHWCCINNFWSRRGFEFQNWWDTTICLFYYMNRIPRYGRGYGLEIVDCYSWISTVAVHDFQAMNRMYNHVQKGVASLCYHSYLISHPLRQPCSTTFLPQYFIYPSTPQAVVAYWKQRYVQTFRLSAFLLAFNIAVW